MSLWKIAGRVAAVIICVGALTGCASDRVSGVAGASLTIKGSAGTAPGVSPSLGVAARASLGTTIGSPGRDASGGTIVGDPSSVAIGMYALYLSTNGDCSAPVLVVDNGASPVTKDFVQNPVLFNANPPSGTYKCVIMRMSDVVHFKSATAGGTCAANTDYAMDIYRAPDTDWMNVDGGFVIATGTDASPSDDKVYLFMTTDTAAALARGISRHQLIALDGSLTVPGNATFYWDAHNSVGYDPSGGCGMNPPALAFR